MVRVNFYRMNKPVNDSDVVAIDARVFGGDYNRSSDCVLTHGYKGRV